MMRLMGKPQDLRQWSMGTPQNLTTSFYGAGEPLNKYTASREIFNPQASRAASQPSMPGGFNIGSILKVVNPETGNEEWIKVNDIGPNKRLWDTRQLDLTAGVWDRLGFNRKQGLGDVQVTPVNRRNYGGQQGAEDKKG